jgi:hypothetical protein
VYSKPNKINEGDLVFSNSLKLTKVLSDTATIFSGVADSTCCYGGELSVH